MHQGPTGHPPGSPAPVNGTGEVRPPSGRSRSVTIRDVARSAGVSHQTVSRVLNAHPNISARTRSRVLAAMERLDYRPSRVARALANGRSGTIGVILTDNGRYGPPKTLQAIERAARDAGYFVSTVNLASVGREQMQTALGHLEDQGIDGLVVIAPQAAMLEAFRELHRGVPYVTVDSAGDGGGHSVAIDQALGARLATQHLVDLGHRTVVHVAGPADWLDSQARTQAWRATLAAAGLDAPPPVVGDWSAGFGHRTALDLARRRDLTAVFASNDQMALGLLHGFHEAGIRVPEDVSVVGFDDIPEAAYFVPALTSVRPDFSELGVRCMTRLHDQLSGGALPPESPIPPDLVIRRSTSAPA